MTVDVVAMLASMLRIRAFEDRISDLVNEGRIHGPVHLGQGQEAVAVGVCGALREGDTMTSSHRGHAAVLAMGAPVDRTFGELLGRAGGLCGGKGGSAHLADVSVGAYGSIATVGGQLPIACGQALASQYLRTDTVAVTFCGDGATNTGTFHESLNLAATWRLPVVFVVENNHYGGYSPLTSTTPIERLADRAVSYGIPSVWVDGNDVLSVRDVADEAVERARGGSGPMLIEADTFLQRGHLGIEATDTRPEGELEFWMARDPINRLARTVVGAGRASVDQLAKIRDQMLAEVDDALSTALSWPEPDPKERFDNVWA